MARKLLTAGTEATANKQHIIQLYQTGKNVTEIIQIYPKISKKTLYRYLTKWNISIRNHTHYQEYMENNKQKIIKQYKEGLTAPEIAEQHQRVDKKTILRYLKKWGVSIKTTKSVRRKIEKNHKKEIIELYKSGKNIREITTQYPDIPQSSTYHYLSQWDVKMRASNDDRRVWSDWCWINNREVRRINEYYNHTCQFCGLKQNPYDKKYSMKRHHQWEKHVTVILLCKKCHDEYHSNPENDQTWTDNIRGSHGVKSIKNKVKEYYNHTCQICGNTNTKLVIHHIWQTPVIELAICKKCHRKTHKKIKEGK